jgi:hypothetical protein
MLYPPAGKEESLEVADATDMLNAQACVNSDLAEVLRLGERTDEARAALEHTLALTSAKATSSWPTGLEPASKDGRRKGLDDIRACRRPLRAHAVSPVGS